MELESIFKNFDRLIVLDTETTGLNFYNNQIIDLGVIEYKSINDCLVKTNEINILIKLEDNKKLPLEIVNLTHITDSMLNTYGISLNEAKTMFFNLLNNDDKKLIATYNAQFDLSFLRYFLKGYHLNKINFLDILTIYKDRAVYPQKLKDAVSHYHLDEIVKNSHRAMDDTLACFEVLKEMSKEKDDIINYVNLFGYNPNYGQPKILIKNVIYKPQPVNFELPVFPLYKTN